MLKEKPGSLTKQNVDNIGRAVAKSSSKGQGLSYMQGMTAAATVFILIMIVVATFAS